MRGVSHFKWHPSHRFFPNDDVLECDKCGCRTYSTEAKLKCVAPKPVQMLNVPRRFHSGAAANCDCTVCVTNRKVS